MDGAECAILYTQLNIVIFAAVVNALLVPCNSMQAPYVKVF